jgi:hypothetical protein
MNPSSQPNNPSPQHGNSGAPAQGPTTIIVESLTGTNLARFGEAIFLHFGRSQSAKRIGTFWAGGKFHTRSEQR